MYGCMMALGFIAGWYVVSWLCRREGRRPELFTNLLMLMMVSGVVGARIAYVIEHWRAEFANNLAEIIRVDHGGLMFYGGLILAFVCFVGYCIVKRERFLPMADLMAVVVPLGHAFGRIGCFFNGCCYGKQTDSAFGVSFPAMSPAWCEQVREHLIPSTADKALPVLQIPGRQLGNGPISVGPASALPVAGEESLFLLRTDDTHLWITLLQGAPDIRAVFGNDRCSCLPNKDNC